MANLFDLCLHVISAIDNDHLFDAQVGQNHLPFNHFRFPADNLPGIEHRGVRARTCGDFVSSGFYRFRVNFREVHERMNQAILESDTEKLLRPHIEPVSFHIDIRGKLLNFFRGVLAKNRRLGKYASDVLFNRFLIGRKERCRRQTIVIAFRVFIRPFREIYLPLPTHFQRSAHQRIVNIPRLNHVVIVEVGC